MSPPPRARLRVRVVGVVQGVGFRPFCHQLATALGVAGFVTNDTHGVRVEIEGETAPLDQFLLRLRAQPPPLAVIESITVEPIEPVGARDFVITPSAVGDERHVLISPDIATCDDCVREIFDPADRRHRYAFTNCTNCGPRLTIVTDVPYDRGRTTMADFPLCAQCEKEYADPSDRRFHAQPVCCPDCGPQLRLVGQSGDPIVETAALLRDGAVVAIKGLGGYHLAALASSESAVARLRSRKHREEKPFAVMVRDVSQALLLCSVDDVERGLLTSPRRPIVLLRRRDGIAVAGSVAPGNRWLGLLLPYTPLHHLLAAELDEPFVLTSGNVSDEPIAFCDDDALQRLASIADHFLVHDRPIRTRVDDSVVRAFRGRALPVRRSRGYAPQPVALPVAASRPLLACGAELKSTFCLAKDRYAFISHHIGDLENAETLASYREGIAHYRQLFGVRPEVVVHDLHPEYLSTKYAHDLVDVELFGVQHHHAHIASCLADNGVANKVIGVAFDGLGYGTDETIWGGEFLVADLVGFERVGRFRLVAMPGGTAAIREPWRMAAAYLEGAPDLDVVRRNSDTWATMQQMTHAKLNSPMTSSVGRLFDAVAAVLGVRDHISYEGQAAIELEQLARPELAEAYEARIDDGSPFEVVGGDLVRAAADDLQGGVHPATIASRFHSGVVAAVVAGCEMARQRSGLATAALSGGVFQNMLLADTAVRELERRGFVVLTHRQVPPNDGGISFGQAAIAAATLQR